MSTEREPSVPVVAIVGNSDGGKTRVACSLTAIFANRGLRVAAIKHCPHGHDSGGNGSDTARLFEAGATVAVATSPGLRTHVYRSDVDATLESLVADMKGQADIVVAEGFKSSSVPKFLVTDDDAAPGVENVIAVVGEKSPCLGSIPGYRFDEMGRLAEQVLQELVLDIASDLELQKVTFEAREETGGPRNVAEEGFRILSSNRRSPS